MYTNKGSLAISQIIILMISIIAISYAIGGGVGLVSAQAGELCIKSYPSGVVYKVNDINPVNWCDNNGGEEVCTYSPHKIRVDKIVSCSLIGTGVDFTGGLTNPSGSNIPATVGQAVIDRTFDETWRRALEGFRGEDSTPEQIDDLRRTLKDAGASDEVIDSIISEDLTPEADEFLKEIGSGAGSTGAGFFKRYVTGNFYKQSLVTGAVIGGVIVAITFFSVGIRTGDWGRAREAAGRVAIGAGVGLGAYVGAVALGLGPAGWIAGGFVMVGVWASKFLSREQERTINFQCKPWQPQTGGDNCNSCDDGDFPCTEYQCRSLGTGCELINKDTDEPRCIHKDRNDVDPPEITPWVDVLSEGYKYDPLPRGQTGVEIKYQDEECLPSFAPFALGVELDKEGYCRIEWERTADFSDMRFDLGGRNIFTIQHSQIMSFPGVANIQDYLDKLELEGDSVIEITNNGEYEFYVRCQAASNGKARREEFLFKFCIDKGPDTTSPIIRGFNWIDGAPIAYFGEGEEREVGVQVYTNEPSSCKWDHEDKDYKDMENQMVCSDSLTNFNSQLSYTCSGDLTGLENNKENKFFFRCNDTFGNVNSQSKTLTLIGTRQLYISEVKPNETTIRGSTNSIKVTLEATTSAGYKEGESICSYSNTRSGTYIKFSDTNSHQHSTNVWLEPGNYNYVIRCIDQAGNSDTKELAFTIETDTQAPVVVRAFHETTFLKLITNEKAECVYSTDDCSYLFEDGIGMNVVGDTGHTTNWDPDTSFYIKCQDEFENRPFPKDCSITVRPFET